MDLDLVVEEHEEGYAVLRATGEVDAYTAPRLRERLVELADRPGPRIILDLEGVEFLDSTGLGALVAALKRVKANEGALSLICTRENIIKVFRITGLDRVIPIHESMGAAAEAERNRP